jgi:hypothetical protein
MSKDWVSDIEAMHAKYGVNDWVNNKLRVNTDGSKESLQKFLHFRMKFLNEELLETQNAIYSKDAEEIVDGLIDLCVVAIGTLDAFGVDAYKAWDKVLEANMSKVPGVKPERPNPLGLPDLIKPVGWIAPNHEDNHGHLPYTF